LIKMERLKKFGDGDACCLGLIAYSMRKQK
jgi:hypothetical protein